MATSIDALDLPIQLFAVGTAVGMMGALLHNARTGEVERWPVYVAIPATSLFLLGVLQTVVGALC